MSNQSEENPQNFYNPLVQAKILLQIHFLFNLKKGDFVWHKAWHKFTIPIYFINAFKKKMANFN
jgi:hypothetical protein